MDPQTLKRRSKQAASLLKKITAVWNGLDKIPSFNGKTPFMDKVNNARIEAHTLAENLKLDAQESK